MDTNSKKIIKCREEAIKQLILKQYKKGLSIEHIADINDFDIGYVKSVIKKELA